MTKRAAKQPMNLVDAVVWARGLEPDYADLTAAGIFVVVLTAQPPAPPKREPLWAVGVSLESIDEARDRAVGNMAVAAVQAGVTA